jgi:hypothetical protein
MASPNNVYFIKGTITTDKYIFNNPILFQKGCLHIAPMRNQQKQSNELFLVNQKENLIHLWQDPVSTIWQERVITIKSEGFLLNFNSFTTHIKIVDHNTGIPITGQKVELTSSEWTFVSINGKIYSLDKNTPAEIMPDFRGSIEIIYMAKDISPPILHLSASFLNQTINIYQNGKILNGISKIKSGANIQNAKDSEGNPILTKKQSTQVLNGVANNLQQLTTSSSASKSGTIPKNTMFVS